MGRLDDITLEELHEVREQTEGGIPRERVLAAIGRKQGDYIDTLAERHDVAEKTIRNWLDRFEKFQETVKKKTGANGEDSCCRRSVHQASWDSPTTRLVSDRLKSNHRDIEFMG
jgi:hypothetical protein